MTMKHHRLDRILALDIEMTCWEGEPPAGMSPEPIEIGLVEADVETLEILREGRYLIRPTRSEVSPFCEDLTGLSAALLKKQGRRFEEAMRSIAKEFGVGSKACVAWGNDWTAIEVECALRGASNPFPAEHAVNLGGLYTLLAGEKARIGQSQAVEGLGLEFEGRPHGAVADARAALSVWRELAGDLRSRLRDADPTPSPR